ncbi:uncharacterized protein K444DRAFT_633484 [Hyaloscypha bicolor E]|uniref:Uncharacterized protein n=1 Tax=Hyaloscypha bicolor E TaxID=1095630 RepID=A0A2J6SYW5_9HELO|nr:uncharacterized protein K444DRAFT_633484 [Hyaloscypha bicolor E]PMD55971.1 hypothetical protein K444DRAFT_633484 [Hyaloscypha bicolor E]
MLWGPGDDQSLMAEPRPSTLHLSGHIIYNWKMCGHCWQQIFNYAPKGCVSKQISKIYNADTVQIQQLRCAKQNGVSSWTFSRGRRNVINAAAVLAGMLHCQIIAFRFLIVEIFFWPRDNAAFLDVSAWEYCRSNGRLGVLDTGFCSVRERGPPSQPNNASTRRPLSKVLFSFSLHVAANHISVAQAQIELMIPSAWKSPKASVSGSNMHV